MKNKQNTSVFRTNILFRRHIKELPISNDCISRFLSSADLQKKIRIMRETDRHNLQFEYSLHPFCSSQERFCNQTIQDDSGLLSAFLVVKSSPSNRCIKEEHLPKAEREKNGTQHRLLIRKIKNVVCIIERLRENNETTVKKLSSA